MRVFRFMDNGAPNENPAISGGVRNDPKLGGESQTGSTQLQLGGDALFRLGRLAQHVAAAPDGLDVVLADQVKLTQLTRLRNKFELLIGIQRKLPLEMSLQGG